MKRRSYHQYCGVAKALDRIGDRWTALIVRTLALGPQRYSELLRALPGITTNLLAKRLKEMEAEALIETLPQPESDGRFPYRLTRRGAELAPVLQALAKWGWQFMDAPERGDLQSIEYLLFALPLAYRGGASLRGELVVAGAPYRVLLEPARARIERGELPAPHVRMSGPASAIARVFLANDERVPRGVECQGAERDVRALRAAFDSRGFTFGWSGAAARSRK